MRRPAGRRGPGPRAPRRRPRLRSRCRTPSARSCGHCRCPGRSPAGSAPIPSRSGPCSRPRWECRPGRCPAGPCRGPPADACPKHLRQPLVDHVLGQLGIVAAEGGDPPGTSQPDAAFSDQQIEHGPAQRHEGDEEHPRQGNAAGWPPHDHPQRYPQHDRKCAGGSAAWRMQWAWLFHRRLKSFYYIILHHSCSPSSLSEDGIHSVGLKKTE